MPSTSFAVFLPPASLDRFSPPSSQAPTSLWPTVTTSFLLPPATSAELASREALDIRHGLETGPSCNDAPQEDIGRAATAIEPPTEGGGIKSRPLQDSTSTLASTSALPLVPGDTNVASAAQSEVKRSRKTADTRRVQIRASPVLVVETPDRPSRGVARKRARFGTLPRGPSRLSIRADPHSIASDREDLADKSRVVLRDDDDALEDGEREEDGNRNEAGGGDSYVASAGGSGHNDDLNAWNRSSPDVFASEDARAADPVQTISSADAARDTVASLPGASDHQQAHSLSDPRRDASVVCRFSFFSRERSRRRATGPRAHATVAIDSALDRDSTAANLADHTRTIDLLNELQGGVGPTLRSKPHPTIDRLKRLHRATGPHRVSSAFTLPESNASQSHDRPSTDFSSEGTTSASLEQDSIAPPPTLRFALASVTPLSRILASPHAFLQGGLHRGYTAARTAAPTGALPSSGKVNLLVVVKEVGEPSLVTAKYPTEPARPAPGRRGDACGKTSRVELVVMDGRPDPNPDADAESDAVAARRGEKHFFKLVLWGSLASGWVAGVEPSLVSATTPHRPVPSATDHSSLSRSLSVQDETTLPSGEADEPDDPVRSTDPTPLRPGDVVFLSNLSIVNTPTLGVTGSNLYSNGTRRNRLGAGFPPRLGMAMGQGSAVPSCLVAHGSERNATSVELCYRSEVVEQRDASRNFDPEVARFDVKSRRVYELHLLWMQGRLAGLDDY